MKSLSGEVRDRNAKRAGYRAMNGNYKRALVIVALGIAVSIVLFWLAGEGESLLLLQRAKSEFLFMALVAEAVRYLGVAFLTQYVVRLLGRRIELLPTLAVMFASATINRVLYAGGLGGMYLRYRYLEKHNLSLGSVSILFLLQFMISAVVLLGSFLFGILYLMLYRGLSTEQVWWAAFILFLFFSISTLAIYLYLRRQTLERLALALTSRLGRIVHSLVRRNPFEEKKVRSTISRLYRAVDLATATRNRRRLLAIFAFATLTLLADILCLYFVFSSLGFDIPFGKTMAGYTMANYLASASTVPEGVLVAEGTLALAYVNLAIPRRVVALAILIFRFISFWLPIPLGIFALYVLRRRSLI